MALAPLPAPQGFRPPLIPFFHLQLIDGEEFAWNVDMFGAVALVWSCSFKKQTLVMIAGKIGAPYEAETGIWRISDAYKAAQQGLTMEAFISRSSERPWARQDLTALNPWHFSKSPRLAPRRCARCLRAGLCGRGKIGFSIPGWCSTTLAAKRSCPESRQIVKPAAAARNIAANGEQRAGQSVYCPCASR